MYSNRNFASAHGRERETDGQQVRRDKEGGASPGEGRHQIRAAESRAEDQVGRMR